MKEYKYNGYDYPLIKHDNGKITYRDYEIEPFCNTGNKVIPKHIIKEYYQGEMSNINRIIKHNQYKETHKEKFENLPTMDECLDELFKEWY